MSILQTRWNNAVPYCSTCSTYRILDVGALTADAAVRVSGLSIFPTVSPSCHPSRGRMRRSKAPPMKRHVVELRSSTPAQTDGFPVDDRPAVTRRSQFFAVSVRCVSTLKAAKDTWILGGILGCGSRPIPFLLLACLADVGQLARCNWQSANSVLPPPINTDLAANRHQVIQQRSGPSRRCETRRVARSASLASQAINSARP
jgi:hypothetical protein